MLIQNKVSDFLVFETESVLKALEKINQNKNRIVFIVNENGKLSGSFSDGDFRRWITTGDFDFNIEISQVMNTAFLSKRIDASRREIESLFTKGINVIPLIDEYRRFVAVAIQDDRGISIGKHVISESSPAFIIAEIGNNHNGDINLAKHLVDLAVEANADCVKFQMRDLGQLYKGGEDKDKSADLGAQYTHDLLSRFQLSNESLIEVFDYCKAKGLTPMCTPWDLNSLNVLEQYGMEAYKVASADFTNHEMLEALAATGKPLICSTGMCTEAEIKKSVEFLKSLSAQFVILHCNSTYPTPFKDVNLSYIKRLQNITGGVVGYSGHERGISIPIAAVALGAKVIEKHFTIDKAMEGNDHKVSLLPNEFSDMVSKIREVEESMGKGGERLITQGEMINRENLAKSLIINQNLKKGQIITRSMVEIKSPGQGLQPLYIDQLIGRSAIRDFVKGDFFYESDLNDVPVESRNYSFSRPFGIPVRYHDYDKLKAKSNLDFVEFHLSYQDLELNLADFFIDQQSMGFAVHSPELFANDHILDLASEDDEYRIKSIDYLNKVCEITRQLKHYFPVTERPVIVVNAGGFNTKGFIPKEKTAQLYKRVAALLNKSDFG
ncbi:TPA: N-acetylneuraminate synthase family protein [Klebsiella pneumoniae]|nr:N-acetylneuraminate synthase family protein [Klebsiella pneumoniae]